MQLFVGSGHCRTAMGLVLPGLSRWMLYFFHSRCSFLKPFPSCLSFPSFLLVLPFWSHINTWILSEMVQIISFEDPLQMPAVCNASFSLVLVPQHSISLGLFRVMSVIVACVALFCFSDCCVVYLYCCSDLEVSGFYFSHTIHQVFLTVCPLWVCFFFFAGYFSTLSGVVQRLV